MEKNPQITEVNSQTTNPYNKINTIGALLQNPDKKHTYYISKKTNIINNNKPSTILEANYFF
ncbi:MAG: hypothetical protein BZ136_01885 [Methanosphaera sp. rholeuAM74]|nr:MAG: hypothetical protein BZ136_01885 [Methanosphaera sp. rholeuAM74]